MENKTMFVIMFDFGRYEDQTSKCIAVMDDLEKANNFVNDKNSIYDSMRNKLTILSKAKEKWLKDNPQPIMKEYHSWTNALLEFSKEWMKVHLTEEELKAEKEDDDHYYYVEEVPFL